ncbi:MAG: polysaccharide biosynthesis tyrosine autokinase [Gammaproteobacteria bacterium]
MADEPRQNMQSEQESDEIDLREIVANLLDGKWWILGFAGVFLACGLLYAFLARPVYQANVLMQVKQQQSILAGLQDLKEALGQPPPADAEIQIIRSRAVLLKAIAARDLSVTVEPDVFPLIGRFFVSGDPSVDIVSLDVPQTWYRKSLKLTAGAAGQFVLHSPAGEKLIQGTVGQLEKAARPGDDVAINVARIDAKPGFTFSLTKLNPLRVYKTLLENLDVSEQGHDTGILLMTLEGHDPVAVAATLNAIAQSYVDESIALQTLQAKKSLDFISAQLPSIQNQANQAESSLSAYQTRKGSVDMTLEAKALVDQASKVEAQLTELNLQSAELSQQFTPDYPASQALNQQRQTLLAQKTSIESAIRALPQTQQDLIGLEREVKVSNQVYTYLLNRSEQFKIEQAGSTGNARIIDTAVAPIKPVKPEKSLVAALALFLGLFTGVVVVFIRRVFLGGIEDPDTLERQLGLPVYAVVPHSKAQAKHAVKEAETHHGVIPVLAVAEPQDMAVEALRSLRTSLNFAFAGAGNHIITLGGPRPVIGKSFISVNLAHVLADAGKKVLIMDADLRRGHLHQYFGVQRQPGLSQILSGENTLESCVVPSKTNPGVALLPTGILPPNPSELLMGERFAHLLEKAGSSYDMVLIDLPPYLAVTDGLIIAAQAATNLVVLRAGIHPLREIEHVLGRLRQNNIPVTGFVLNDLMPRSAAYGYRKYGYAYTYKYSGQKP